MPDVFTPSKRSEVMSKIRSRGNRETELPVRNRAFWRAKLEANRRRDRLVGRTLRRGGWRVLRVWEHELLLRNRTRLVARLRWPGGNQNEHRTSNTEHRTSK